MTRRGQLVLAYLIAVALFLALWLASAVAYAVTGVPG